MIKAHGFEIPKYNKYKSVEQQLEHLESEIEEVRDAYKRKTPEEFQVEVTDILFSAITLFRNAIPDEDKEKAVAYVIYKNKKRGYYD